MYQSRAQRDFTQLQTKQGTQKLGKLQFHILGAKPNLSAPYNNATVALVPKVSSSSGLFMD